MKTYSFIILDLQLGQFYVFGCQQKTKFQTKYGTSVKNKAHKTKRSKFMATLYRHYKGASKNSSPDMQIHAAEPIC